MATVTWRNLKRLDRKLKDLGGAKAKKALRRGTREAAKVIQVEAKKLAPKRTGRLRRGIRVRALKRSRRATFVGSMAIVGSGFFQGAEFYGAFQEFGWKTGRRGSSGRRQIPGRHFMRNAARRKKKRAVRVFLGQTNRMIRQIARS